MSELFREHYDEDALRAIPTLTLAHVGDSVYELLARSAVAARGGCRVEDAHRQTVALVSAPAQARAAETLLPLLTREEREMPPVGGGLPPPAAQGGGHGHRKGPLPHPLRAI